MSVDDYLATVGRYAEYLKDHPESIGKLVDLFNQKGVEYFGAAYVSADKDIVKENADLAGIDIYNKRQFIDKKRSEEGHEAESPDEEVLFMNEASFNDAFRHTIFLDVSDPADPKLVSPPQGILKDYVLTWENVQRLPEVFPDGNRIAVHLDFMEHIFFPVPTKPTTGGFKKAKRSRKTRRRSSRRSSRKANAKKRS